MADSSVLRAGIPHGVPGGGILMLRLHPAHSMTALCAPSPEPAVQPLAGILQSLAGSVTVEQTFGPVPEGGVYPLEERAADNGSPSPHPFRTFLTLDGQAASPTETTALFDAALTTPAVAEVWCAMPLLAACTTPTPDFETDQHHLDAAPVGVGARAPWGLPNGQGEGVKVAAVDFGFEYGHEALVGRIATMDGANSTDADERAHGTATVGVIAAAGDHKGIVGVAPGLAGVAAVCTAKTDAGLAPALVTAAGRVSAGDILVVPLASTIDTAAGTQGPVESVLSTWTAIKTAVGAGVIVVEAVGNSIRNIDGDLTLGDSGAILVSSAMSDRGTNPLHIPQTAGGTRVDCWAWGDSIVTSGGNDLWDPDQDPNCGFTALFGGTSGASAIIAGAAAILQSRYRHVTTLPLSPAAMRTALASLGTPWQTDTLTWPASRVMPDLDRIVREHLGLVSDAFVRDYVGDTGVTPGLGAMGSSPDILVNPTAIANPKAVLGEGSGTENDDTLYGSYAPSATNYLYVRVRNRGAATAEDLVATVYRAPTGTLTAPSGWVSIGTTTPVDVAADGLLTVLPALTWTAPAEAHCCFIAVLGCADDPAPPLPTAGWSALDAFVRNHNNVAWRNVAVVATTTAAPWIRLGNLAGSARRFDFELEWRVPPSVRVYLEGAAPAMRVVSRLWGLSYADTTAGLGRIQFPRLPRLRPPPLLFNAGAWLNVRWVVEGGTLASGHRLTILQRHQGVIVGGHHTMIKV